jgi:hypothetical protein
VTLREKTEFENCQEGIKEEDAKKEKRDQPD